MVRAVRGLPHAVFADGRRPRCLSAASLGLPRGVGRGPVYMAAAGGGVRVAHHAAVCATAAGLAASVPGRHLVGRGCSRVRAGLYGVVSGGGAGHPAHGPGHAQRGPGSATAGRAGLLLGGPGLCPGWATAPAGRLLLPHLRLLFQRLYLVLAQPRRPHQSQPSAA